MVSVRVCVCVCVCVCVGGGGGGGGDRGKILVLHIPEAELFHPWRGFVQRNLYTNSFTRNEL